ncbi:hypothetical protein HOP50_15g74500 [Chloropicon primus]|uniref:RING-type domain-containing protein n=1 Tax=Chloropicon primus TaxID=1764295 RepID=A0A5B8MWQ6_9CHLO|nr:hypothetical protein A3770_15p74250 [Chloropicon primus]UPR04116.1 hypothetical protein HOP50_15g74500 [Chloropicon primus]|mmetsp:Transcript_14619/g.41758  ORF Transcript_14619/g.41758 Transcript_14619/m.41758 type:complete len:238 (-) Transcript_14619:920-1633(-)|eukprot:QDZ24907.1 hypothetical protein A3770_15p74250 [Chloropicon primus]
MQTSNVTEQMVGNFTEIVEIDEIEPFWAYELNATATDAIDSYVKSLGKHGAHHHPMTVIIIPAVVLFAVGITIAQLTWCWRKRTGLWRRRTGQGGGSLEDGTSLERKAVSTAVVPLRRFSYHASGPKKTEDKYSNTECCVCMARFGDGDEVAELPHCGHIFHERCLGAWLARNASCPLCRRDVRGSKRAAERPKFDVAVVGVSESGGNFVCVHSTQGRTGTLRGGVGGDHSYSFFSI